MRQCSRAGLFLSHFYSNYYVDCTTVVFAATYLDLAHKGKKCDSNTKQGIRCHTFLYVVVFGVISVLLPFMLCIPEFTLQTLGEVTIEDLYGCVVTGGS